MSKKSTVKIGIAASVVLAVTLSLVAATPTVTDVVAKQRYPWNGLVDITCKVTGISGTDQWKFSVAAVMPDTGNARKVYQFWVVKNGVNSTDKKVQANGAYKLLWDAKAELGQVSYDNMVMRVTVVELHEKVQLWEGGPYWADTNIGAENPEDYGYYFWWGDTVGYKRENDKWGDGFSFFPDTPTLHKSVATLASEGWITSDGVLAPEHDAAHAHWGGNWRMPTSAEFTALLNNCTTTWTTQNGVYGRLVTGKGAYAGRSIFLPAAGYGDDSYLAYPGSDGYYWTSTPYSDDSSRAWYLFISSDTVGGGAGSRWMGQSVRPVRGFAENTYTVTLDRQGGSGGTANVTATYGSAMPSITVPTRSGYTFDGYYTETDGRGTQYYTASGVSACNWGKASATTLYAKWTAVDADGHRLVQLWEGGPYWATANIGAKNPEDYGYYFWWGDTVGYKRENDKWRDGFAFFPADTPTNDKSVATLESEGWITSDGVLAPEHDAAHAHWGGNWRMPTKAELTALLNNCTTTWTTQNGVYGLLVTGKGAYADRSIFLPFAGYGNDWNLLESGRSGYYWSSTPGSYDPYDAWNAWDLTISSGVSGVGPGSRWQGKPVRPVRGFAGTYTVTLDRRRGSGGTASVTATYGSAMPSITVPTRSGYTFGGYYTSAGGSGTQYYTASGVSARNWDKASATTLYAKWTAIVDADGHDKVQLWEDGPYWATTNIGAENPEDYGYYFWWGDTVGYKRENDKWGDGFSFSPSNTPSFASEGWITSDGVLAPEHDAAHAHWGDNWRMPTSAEFTALLNNCTTTLTTQNGVYGLLVTGKGAYADRSIFLPAAGFGNGSNLGHSGSDGDYWSSTADSDYSRVAGRLYFSSSYIRQSGEYRYYGQPVRPVRGFAE